MNNYRHLNKEIGGDKVDDVSERTSFVVAVTDKHRVLS